MVILKIILFINSIILIILASVSLYLPRPERRIFIETQEIELILFIVSLLGLGVHYLFSNHLFQMNLLKINSEILDLYPKLIVSALTLFTLIILLILPIWENNIMIFAKLMLPSITNALLVKNFFSYKNLFFIFFFIFLNSCFCSIYLFFVTVPLIYLLGFD